jgi:hypothetical protein
MAWKSILLRGVVVLGVLSHGLMAQQNLPQLVSPAASKAQAEFKTASQEAHATYAAALKTALKAAMTAGDLTEANAINSVENVVADGGVPPKPQFKSPRGLQAAAAFEASMSKAAAQCTAILQVELKATLAKGDLREANAIQDVIKGITPTPSAAQSVPSAGAAWESADMVVTGKGFTIAPLNNNEAAFSNRGYVWKGVPVNLQGSHFTRINGGVHPQIKVRAKQNTDIQVFTDVTTDAKVDLTGWERTGAQFILTNGKKSHVVVFKKKLEAGQEIDVPQGNWTGVLVLLPSH